MNKTIKGRRALLACWLLALLCLLSGCTSQIQEREMIDLSDKEIRSELKAPAEDGVQTHEQWVTLYYLSEDGTMLCPVARKIAVQADGSRARAALDALLQGPQDGEDGVQWPDLGVSRSTRLLEVSSGVATVDLPAHARTLPQETLYAVRAAIANTLTEFQEISYVNVLVGGREEGLDLGATLPVGTLAHEDDLNAGARYSRLHEQRSAGEGITLLTTLYFPSADGKLLLPEVRNVAYAEVSPIEYLYTLLGELGKGAGLSLCAQEVPAPLEFIKEMPEIVRTEDGYLAIELCFDAELEEELARGGLTLGVYLAMLSDTLMGFVPGVEGLKISVGEEAIESLSQERTPDGHALDFDQGIVTRGYFAGYTGAPVVLYAMEGDGLARVERVLGQAFAGDARARLTALMAQDELLPKEITEEDILAIDVGETVIAVNLSGDFAKALGKLPPQQERAAVYAMVNTLTENMNAQQTAFFFEGEQVVALGGALEMRGVFTRNPGMVVN